MRKFLAPFVAAGLSALVSLGATFTASAAEPQPLVSASWLNEHLKDPGVVVLDIRPAAEGANPYADAHIPGALHSDYNKGGWRVTRDGVPMMLPTVAELETLVGGLGIASDSRVVVVPAGANFTDFGAAARVYWTLKVVGVDNVSILDGGAAAWKAAGLPLDKTVTKPSPVRFTAALNEKLLSRVGDVTKADAGKNVTLLDARPASYFAGKEKAPAAKAYGHIPGAVNIDSASFYDSTGNRLKPRAELAALAAQLPAQQPVIAYCNTGHWAATDWFVLHEMLGRQDVSLYDGSMVEWTTDAARPLASSRTKWDDVKKTLGIGL